jgi:hypothetical protein
MAIFNSYVKLPEGKCCNPISWFETPNLCTTNIFFDIVPSFVHIARGYHPVPSIVIWYPPAKGPTGLEVLCWHPSCCMCCGPCNSTRAGYWCESHGIYTCNIGSYPGMWWFRHLLTEMGTWLKFSSSIYFRMIIHLFMHVFVISTLDQAQTHTYMF